jgi:AcrR family transcriptional regulator
VPKPRLQPAAKNGSRPAEPPPRRSYTPRLPREQRGELILDAALRLLAREGFAALTVERVAKEAEIAKPSVYAIFESAEGIQTALMRREQQRAFAVAAATVAELTQGDPIAGIASALRRFLEGVAEHPDSWRLVLMPTAGTPPAIHQAILAGREQWRQQIIPRAAAILTHAGIDDLDPELVAHLARGNAEYLARLVLEEPDRYDNQRILEFAEHLLARIAALTSGDNRQ